MSHDSLKNIRQIGIKNVEQTTTPTGLILKPFHPKHPGPPPEQVIIWTLQTYHPNTSGGMTGCLGSFDLGTPTAVVAVALAVVATNVVDSAVASCKITG